MQEGKQYYAPYTFRDSWDRGLGGTKQKQYLARGGATKLDNTLTS